MSGALSTVFGVFIRFRLIRDGLIDGPETPLKFSRIRPKRAIVRLRFCEQARLHMYHTKVFSIRNQLTKLLNQYIRNLVQKITLNNDVVITRYTRILEVNNPRT